MCKEKSNQMKGKSFPFPLFLSKRISRAKTAGLCNCCHRATLSTNHVTVVTLLTAIYSRYAFGTCVVEGLS